MLTRRRWLPVLARGAARLSLLDGLVAYWKMDEISNGSAAVDRLDSSGNGFTLTDHNTCASSTGILDKSVYCYRANSEYLSHADHASLRLTNAVCIDFWVKTANNGAVFNQMSKGDMNTTEGEFVFYTTTGTTVQYNFRVRSGSTDYTLTLATTTYGAWHYVCAWYDSAAGKIRGSLDNGTVVELACGTPNAGTGDLLIGTVLYGGSLTNFHFGLIDEVGMWNRILTAAEITARYNGGLGLTYPF